MNLLVIEDDVRTAGYIAAAFRQIGNHVACETDGRTGYERVASGAFDVLVVDIMLPSMDGLEIVRRLRADGFTAHITANEAGIVVFTIPFDKGFSAAVDGQRTEIIPCDVAFMGVFVEPGEHEIVFTYRTRMLLPGIAMSLLAAAVLGGYVLLARRHRK